MKAEEEELKPIDTSKYKITETGQVLKMTKEEMKDRKGLMKQLTKAKELIKEMLSILPKENIEGVYEITEEAEQFIREAEK